MLTSAIPSIAAQAQLALSSTAQTPGGAMPIIVPVPPPPSPTNAHNDPFGSDTTGVQPTQGFTLNSVLAAYQAT